LFLKDDLKRSIRECGFEHPSEIQIKAIPHALQGHDLLVQAKSGMGKTAVFVISILNQITPLHGTYKTGEALIICNTRELAHQIYKDFKRLGKYFKKPDLKAECFYGGIPLEENLNILRSTSQSPHIIIGTPGRLF
jgi:superfamily II DNA/RNA helicase